MALNLAKRTHHGAPGGARNRLGTAMLYLGTRHWDGYVREECVRQLVGIDRPWVVPFVVQLLGEYVLEIVDVVAAAIPGVNAAQFSEFVRENRGFMATTRRRMTSYWDCYFRGRFPTLQTSLAPRRFVWKQGQESLLVEPGGQVGKARQRLVHLSTGPA
jgi:hypothetical protein